MSPIPQLFGAPPPGNPSSTFDASIGASNQAASLQANAVQNAMQTLVGVLSKAVGDATEARNRRFMQQREIEAGQTLEGMRQAGEDRRASQQQQFSLDLEGLHQTGEQLMRKQDEAAALERMTSEHIFQGAQSQKQRAFERGQNRQQLQERRGEFIYGQNRLSREFDAQQSSRDLDALKLDSARKAERESDRIESEKQAALQQLRAQGPGAFMQTGPGGAQMLNPEAIGKLGPEGGAYIGKSLTAAGAVDQGAASDFARAGQGGSGAGGGSEDMLRMIGSYVQNPQPVPMQSKYIPEGMAGSGLTGDIDQRGAAGTPYQLALGPQGIDIQMPGGAKDSEDVAAAEAKINANPEVLLQMIGHAISRGTATPEQAKKIGAQALPFITGRPQLGQGGTTPGQGQAGPGTTPGQEQPPATSSFNPAMSRFLQGVEPPSAPPSAAPQAAPQARAPGSEFLTTKKPTPAAPPSRAMPTPPSIPQPPQSSTLNAPTLPAAAPKPASQTDNAAPKSRETRARASELEATVARNKQQAWVDAGKWASETIMRGKAMAKRPNAGDVYNRTPENVAANMQGKRDAYTTARKALLKMLESGPDETSSMRIAELDRLAKEQGVIQ